MAKLIACWLGFLCVLVSTSALGAGRIEVPRGPLELRQVAGNYEAVFDVRNVGSDPLFVSRVAPRTDADDVRLPRRVMVRFESGQTSGTIPPHQAAHVHVTWTPDRETHIHAFYGHVMVTSTDESAGEVAVGIAAHAGSLGFLGRHLLSTIVMVPLVASALLGLLLLAAGGGRTGRRPRVLALAASLACAAAALLAWGTFDAELSRADGGDGFQLVERASFVRALGMEIFLGVDGASLPLVVLCALAAPCGVLASWGERRNPSIFFACYMLLVGASLGALVALDAALFFGCLALAAFAAFVLVGLFGKGEGSASAVAASRMLLLCGTGLVVLVVALFALHAVSVRTFLGDGSPVTHTWAFTELSRIDFVGARVRLFGAPLAKCAFVLSFIGLACVGAVFPFHAWLRPVLRSAPPAVALMILAGLTRAAMLGLLRIDLVLLPESTRWAAPMLGAIGAAGALYGALVAMGDRDLVGIVTFGIVSLSGVAVVGIASLTPEALLGTIGGIAAAGCAGASAMLVLGFLRERIATLDAREIRGIGIEAPLFASMLGVAALGAAAVPGSASFWSVWLVGLGEIVRDPSIATAVLVSAVLLAASQTMPMLKIVRGRLPELLHRGESLTPYGGRVPEVRPREVAALAPLLVLIVVLGFYPAPLLGRAQVTARDMNELVNRAGPGQIN